MLGQSSLKSLLHNARKRELTHLAADKTALAAAIVMGGAIVLLLVGTQILDWYWLLLLAVASLGTGLYRLRKSIPSLYALAQRLDRRLKLADALSTAQYFSDHPAPGREPICEMQRESAETVARQVDLKAAVPFVRSRYLLPAAVLAVAAAGLFGVRYLVTGSLNLQPSLLKIAYDSFFGTKTYDAKNQLPPRAKFDPKAGGNTPQDNPLADSDVPPEELNPDNPNASPGGDSTKENGANPADQNDAEENQGKQDGKEAGDPNSAGKNGQDKNQKSDNAKNSDKNGNPDSKGGNNSDSGLMDKLRDALANMMNKMKSSSEDKKQQAQNSQKGQQGDRKEQGQKGEQSKENQPSQDNNGDTQSEGDQKDASNSESSEKASQKNASQDAKNGIGSQDGEKALREAEQLQAMGKISEILGKRSASVSGDMMIEVGSSKQTLKTPWAQRQASHGEAGGEIHRDEVPLMYQPFVQQYFEEIRKTAPSSAGAKPAVPAGNNK